MQRSETVIHDFEPICNEHSKILILGTMPSPKSREIGFYYGHPRNRFWPVLAEVCGEQYPETKQDKIDMVLRNHIAIWDVLAGCDICGADDSSIKNPVPNDMDVILHHADIKAVFTTGSKATTLFKKYCTPKCGMEAIMLPSTSPANAKMKFEQLVEAYRVIMKYL